MKNNSQQKRLTAGFTLIELLVVVGIIAVLVGMAVVGVNAARNAARDVAGQQFLAGISMALSQYERDFNDLPPSNFADVTTDSFGVDATSIVDDQWSGAEILAQALVGPRSDDGERGPGYRQTGRNYGAYLDAHDTNNLVYLANADEPPFEQYDSPDGTYYVPQDGATFDRPDGRWGLTTNVEQWPILYYRAEPQGTTGAGDIWSDGGRFDTRDNETILNASGHDADDPATTYSEAFVMTLRSSDFLLAAPGRDNRFGTEDDTTTAGP
ncbi:MAG: type II secretion system protein [Phycisphaeraceae bacterium]